jgi:hypothetical protein
MAQALSDTLGAGPPAEPASSPYPAPSRGPWPKTNLTLMFAGAGVLLTATTLLSATNRPLRSIES